MARPRKSLICLDDTPYYHCVSRCVRRAYLCGEDPFSGKSYEHRRGWVEQRLQRLAKVFAIDICAYAIMSNHSHLVLHVDKEEALGWSIDEVLRRWHALHRGTLLTRQYAQLDIRKTMSTAQVESVLSAVKIYRQRLYDISWFMRLLNEFIAREANKEDDCTGHFWEGRFKSQALQDEAALTACMVYVDLNPLRAGMAKTPASSDFTSIKKRLRAAQYNTQPSLLHPFIGGVNKETTKGLPFPLDNYLTLVEHTGRQIQANKAELVVPKECETILLRTGLSTMDWCALVVSIETHFSTTISLSLATHRLSG